MTGDIAFACQDGIMPAWEEKRMDPGTIGAFIPIVALSIPIVAIIAGTLSKKYKFQANVEQIEQIKKLEARVQELESSLHTMGAEVERLNEEQRFTSKLLDDRR